MSILIPQVLSYARNPKTLSIGNAVEEWNDQIIDEAFETGRAGVNLNPQAAASVRVDVKVLHRHL